MASKYEVLQGDAVLATFDAGVRQLDRGGETRTHIDYAVNRLANRPRAMRVRRGSINLRSRAPEYNPRLQGFCLDFFGRARLASVRNFQLVDADEPTVPNDPHAEQKCKLLFGRWSADSFHLDVKHRAIRPSLLLRCLLRLGGDHLSPPLVSALVIFSRRRDRVQQC